MASTLTGTQLITKLQNIVDDVLDETLALQLLNDAKDELESMHIWEQLKKETTYAITAGSSYATAAGALPTRFALDVRMVESTGTPDYHKIAFDDLQAKKNNAFGYFIDLNAGNIHLAGTSQSAKTVHFYYTEYSTDITTSTSWSFPGRFHYLLPIKAAELYYMADAGERSRSWDDKWAQQFERGVRLMEVWNDSIKLRNKGGRQMVATARNTVGRF